MDFAELKTELNTRLDDAENFALTSDEKTSILTEAVNDDYVVKPVWDSSLTFSISAYQYTRPATVDNVQDIYISSSNNTNDREPEPISSNMWEVIDDKIHFLANANDIIPNGYTLFLKGKSKYTASDTITETNVQEYVLNLAQLIAIKKLLIKKTFKFLKNDASVSEIVATKRELEREVMRYRRRLPRSFESM